MQLKNKMVTATTDITNPEPDASDEAIENWLVQINTLIETTDATSGDKQDDDK